MEERKCSRCGTVGGEGIFYKNGNRRDSECKGCRKERSKTYHEKNAVKRRQREKERRQNNPQKYREYEVWRSYGITPEEYYAILDSQENRCAGCRVEFSENTLVCIDHDHKCCPQSRGGCGQCVRGALCNSCNRGLGSLKDSVETMERLIEYMKRNESK